MHSRFLLLLCHFTHMTFIIRIISSQLHSIRPRSVVALLCVEDGGIMRVHRFELVTLILGIYGH